MMARLLLPVHRIMGISLPVPSRMLFVAMPPKLVIMYQEGLAGTVTACLLNIKSIRHLKSPTNAKFSKWESLNTTKNAVILSWNIPANGKVLSAGSEDGLISKMIIKLLTSSSWNQSGMFLNNFLKRALCTEEEKLCHTQMLVPQFCPISKFNSITRKLAIHHCMSVFLWSKIQM